MVFAVCPYFVYFVYTPVLFEPVHLFNQPVWLYILWEKYLYMGNKLLMIFYKCYQNTKNNELLHFRLKSSDLKIIFMDRGPQQATQVEAVANKDCIFLRDKQKGNNVAFSSKE